VDAIVRSMVLAFSLHHKTAIHKLAEHALNLQCPRFEFLLEDPPLDYPFECVLRIRMIFQIGQNLVRCLLTRFTHFQETRHTELTKQSSVVVASTSAIKEQSKSHQRTTS